VPAEALSPIPPALDQLREHPEVAPEEVPGLLERLSEVPDPRDPRGVRHALVVVLALTACAVLAGATSLLAVGEWIADAPPHILERLGIRRDPLFPKRVLPTETTVRRLLARIDGDALDWAVGHWLTDRRPSTGGGLRGVGRGRQEPTGRRQGTRPQDPPACRPRPRFRPGSGSLDVQDKTNEITCFLAGPGAWDGVPGARAAWVDAPVGQESGGDPGRHRPATGPTMAR
jgi:DDE_Tnp_1-associated